VIPSDLFGDPVTLAAEQFRLAQEMCGECRDYHALQPYRRLSGMVNGIEKDSDFVLPALRQLTPPKGRILIAGSADASLLALTWKAAGGHAPAITVADRCRTPLAVCQLYAKAHDFAIATERLDFGSSELAADYDVVFGHGVTRFVPEALRGRFLTALRKALTTKRGAIVLVDRPNLPRADNALPGIYATAVIAGLEAAGVPLPESEAAFRARIDGLAAARPTRPSAQLGKKPLAAHLEAAGFSIHARHEHALRRTIRARDGGASVNFTTEIVVASAADA
jgi:hypothetical protein